MRPMVHGLEAEYWGQIDFVYLDIDDSGNDGVKEQYEFISQPTFILIEADGTVLQRWFGYVSEEEFRQALDAVMQASY
jgi:thioredoxin-like negative regulator of GroEL